MKVTASIGTGFCTKKTESSKTSWNYLIGGSEVPICLQTTQCPASPAEEGYKQLVEGKVEK